MANLKTRVTDTGSYLGALARNKYFWGGLAVLAGVLVGLYLLVDKAALPSYTRQGTAVDVPSVLNQPFEQARAELEERDLAVEKVVQRYNANFPRDVVVDQNPPPDARVKPGRHIYLTVNSGELNRVMVPDLQGLSLREAVNRLRSGGLQVSETVPDSIPAPNANTVTRQNPAPGDSITEGSSVMLWYSTGLGREYVTIPDVTGLSVEEAQQQLLDANLRFVVIGAEGGQEPTEVSEEIVQRQSREPGTSVREGFEIRLYLEEEPPAPPGD
jgi:beta-lactam-binding protein with PASTA domain